MDQMSETQFRRKAGMPEKGARSGMEAVSELKPHGHGKPPRGPMVRKPRGQGASRRGEILDAAKRLFIEEGFANATMRRIAAEVGVSPTALYLHFADKEAILQAIADDYFSELLVVLNKSQAGAAPSLSRLRAGLRAYVNFGMTRYDEYRLTFESRVPRADALICPESDVADMSFKVLEHAVETLLAEGVFRGGHKVVIAETIWCCMHGLTSALVNMPDHVQSQRDILIESVIDNVITGLACPKSAFG
jgi:AcrR family transcriptional regulator